jgi:hypothetical protein
MTLAVSEQAVGKEQVDCEAIQQLAVGAHSAQINLGVATKPHLD